MRSSKTASKHYPELHKRPGSPYWVFRKYSKEKLQEFRKSTGIPAKDSEAATAYKVGRELFDQWLGSTLDSTRDVRMRDLFNSILKLKKHSKGGEKGNTYRSAKNQIENHLIPAFGHLKPNQMTATRWKDYDAEERHKVKFSKYGKPIRRTRLANTRKYLIEAMIRAEDLGLIERRPKFEKLDPPGKKPKYIKRHDLRKILKLCLPQTKLLFFIMWKQGARPDEVLQYRWSMIHWNEGKHGYIHIPAEVTKTGRAREIPLNSRVSRVLRYLSKSAATDLIFPSRYVPGERQRNYRKGWESACQQLGLDLVPYNLRDTFITDTLKRGQSASFVAKYIDSSVAMVEKHYTVLEEEAMRGVAG